MLFKSLVFLTPIVLGLAGAAVAADGAVAGQFDLWLVVRPTSERGSPASFSVLAVAKHDLASTHTLDKTLNKKAFGNPSADATLGKEKRAVGVTVVEEAAVTARALEEGEKKRKPEGSLSF